MKARRTADLSLRATKETARAIGQSMAAERHLWLTLSYMKEKDRAFLRYQEAHKQAAAFQRFLPRRSLALGAAGQEPPPHTNSSYRETQKQSVTSRAPPRFWVLQPVLHSSKEGWKVASYFRSASVELLSPATEVQDAHYQTGRVSDQVRGLVCHDRSKRRILPCLHPSPTQEVPEVCFRG